MGKPKGSLFQLLSSLKLSIPLLFLITAVSVTGSIIPQNRPSQHYLRVFSPEVYNLLNRLQFFDIFHSLFFISLLVLLALNLALCSYRRFPSAWKTVRERIVPLPEKIPERFLRYEFQTPTRSYGEVVVILERILTRKFTRPVSTVDGTTNGFFAQKGVWSRMAVFITHSAILMILAGGLVGGLWGFKAFIAIPESQSVDRVRSDRSGKFIPLGFTIRCEDFTVEYYEKSSRPKEFKSLVSILEDDKVVIDHHPITVNSPLTYKGMTFYQSSFGPAAEPILHINAQDRKTGKEFSYSLSPGEQVRLADGAFVGVLRFSPSFRDLGPVALIQTTSASGETSTQPLFKNAPHISQAHARGAYSFSLAGFDQTYYTGLLVNRDPGVWLVWIGFALMTAGLLMAFTVSHRRLWISVKPLGDMLQVSLWGDSQRNPVAFEHLFQSLARELETGLASGTKEDF